MMFKGVIRLSCLSRQADGKRIVRALSRAATVAAVAFAATPLFRAFLYKLCILVNYRLGVSPHTPPT
jgi:hypothetical protein